MGQTSPEPAASPRRWRRLVVLPVLCLGLAAAAPAQANAPDIQGSACSEGKNQNTLPAPSLDAPQTGRPAGVQGGRKV